MSKGRIENWVIADFFGGDRVFGTVYDSDKFTDGEEIITNVIEKHSTIMGQPVVETKSGSMYHLGKPAEGVQSVEEIFAKYHKDFPN